MRLGMLSQVAIKRGGGGTIRSIALPTHLGRFNFNPGASAPGVCVASDRNYFDCHLSTRAHAASIRYSVTSRGRARV